MRYHIAHSVRGRLRLRVPSPWLRTRQGAVESRLRALTGVRAVAGNTLTGSLRIDYDPFRLAEQSLVDELKHLDAHLTGPPPARRRGAQPSTLVGTKTPLLNVIGATSALAVACLPAPPALAAGLVLAVGLPSLLRAGTALGRRRLNGDVLEASTVLLLAARRHYPAAALLVWLRAVGEYFVARTVVTARRSLRDVVAPPDATVARVEGETTRPARVAALRVGDVVVVPGGQRIPVDGTVVGGEALVNQQTMTGEALPVERRSGDTVFAATAVELGEVVVRVDRVGLDTAVGRIVQAIEATADEKSEIQAFAERLADRDVGRTLGLAVLGTGLSRSIDAGTAILVSDYGAAARVGIPAAIVSSIGQAFRQDILIKGPRVLENLARVDTVVFDKTGTLTLGAPRVTRIARYGSLSEEAIIRLVAAAERPFHHPVARAIGGSPLFVAIDGRLQAMLVLQDQLRDDAPEAVQALRARRMRNVILLSGDHAEPSRVIAESLGLRHHYADLLPEDKARLIGELKAEGRVVAMVGDGVNDALALDEAHVGIAVPGGAEVATEAADVVLLSGGLNRVVRVLDLARDSMEGVRRTLRIAARANLLVVGLASFGFARPVVSILLSHGTRVAAAMLNARATTGRKAVNAVAGSP